MRLTEKGRAFIKDRDELADGQMALHGALAYRAARNRTKLERDLMSADGNKLWTADVIEIARRTGKHIGVSGADGRDYSDTGGR